MKADDDEVILDTIRNVVLRDQVLYDPKSPTADQIKERNGGYSDAFMEEEKRLTRNNPKVSEVARTHGRYVGVESVRRVGVQGDLVQYEATLLIDGDVDLYELQRAFRRYFSRRKPRNNVNQQTREGEEAP